MSEQENGAAGPDLAAGVPLEELREGEPFAARVGDEAVVLVRRGGEVMAIGGSCTHYGGPLADGLVVGETIRCPWHHACFSLRTGEAVGAPALNPVDCWNVEVREGMVYAAGKRGEEPLSPRGRSASGPRSVVIVGAGAAGSAAAEMLRREGYDGPVLLVDPDSAAPYDRPNLSKDYLAGNAPEEWIPLRPDGFYESHGITRITEAAEAIDPRTRTVTLSGGSSLEFGALLLATGSRPITLPIPGADLSHVHTLRSLEDSRRIIAAAEQARAAVVIGASFIGMESAASLRTRGLEVTVVAPETVPFERTLGPEIGALLRRAHEANGVRFRLETTAVEIGANRVRLADGSEVEADLVVVGVGVRPLIALAESAGLVRDGAVPVDTYLETSTPGIFAAGDIALYPDPRSGKPIRVEHWVAAQRQGQTAARNILGGRIPFTDPPFFWTNQWDVGVRYVGSPGRWDRTEVDGDVAGKDAMIRYLAGERVLAVATLGRDRECLREEAELEEVARERAAVGGET